MKSLNHYFNALDYKANEFIMKRKGWRTDRKIIVIESDDWGSIRMPSKKVMEDLLQNNVSFSTKSGYNKYDNLASEHDLEKLLDVLSSIYNRDGVNPIITQNCVMTNPDFDRIKKSNYKKYYKETFIETLSNYPNHKSSFKLWKEGIHSNILRPQFHATEHLNVLMWMKLLQDNVEIVRRSFDRKVFFVSVDSKNDIRKCPLKSYDILENFEYEYLEQNIKEGLSLFKNIFGFKSKSVIAPNYTWDHKIERYYAENDVKFVQGGFKQLYSTYYANKIRKKGKYHYCGEMNNLGLLYLTRNCIFEPSQNPKLGKSFCLRNINEAFKIGKPAIICSHRLNFIGDNYPDNRDNNLLEFKSLFSDILKLWPNVEFMSSDQLGELLINEI